ncbi:TlpA family protein disulfide reductase [Noviherbaspirillum sp. Root189]|uniref:TlpA family protein disulfide reductase n=1 Tax=Noviherbaspirillum sp. Root189 TaxID=1736487 RepID=UPI00070CF571|nr:TlpA disulfide reductase family protein [Noviherbaspirillum sp. Root189]KRB67847.1 hypothetical protein ASE07_09265 [Noviherbaspirillum sp. Root189]
MFRKLILLLASVSLPMVAVSAPLNFTMTDTAGQVHTLDGYRGKWVLVNLWATWCPPCLAEMPELEALSKARRDLVVIGLAVDGQNPQRITQFSEKLHVTYPIVAGNIKLADQFKPRGYPTSYLYDGTGQQIFVKEGPVTREEIESVLRRSVPNTNPKP